MSSAFSNRPGAALEEHASHALAQLTLESPLGQLPRRALVGVTPDTSLAIALGTMQAQHIGSLLVLDAAGAALGILTRHDILGRVSLPQVPLTTPISAVMSTPVRTLTVHDTAHDAALLMARRGIRHVPVTEPGGRVVSMVSERDLFAMQRLSLRQVSATIRGAGDVPTLAHAARDIRRLARELLCQGVGSLQLTQFISYLNDVLSERLVQMLADEHGLDLQRACWLAFGSEGRSEQTISTDQDNGLVFESDDPERDRPRWLALGRSVNEALAACGYPLCKGHVMAGEPHCCMTAAEWCARFAHWMEHGAPEDLLASSIYFDFRPLMGRLELALPMRELVTGMARQLPRFIKQMAENALRNGAPLTWLGGIQTERIDGRSMLDLKFHGAMIYVDAARLYALANGIAHTGTRQRFEAVAQALNVPPSESEAWIGGFEYLQLLRLRAQIINAEESRKPNLLDVGALNDIDRRVLKEALRVARRLQQRIELDYQR
jgi:CBS domain-containing protein